MNGFGSQTGASLFGQPQGARPSGGLFGANGSPSTSAFGQAGAAKPAQASGGLFGSTNTGSGGLFGSSNSGQAAGAPQQTSNLFGSSTTANNNSGGGLFGGNTANSFGSNTPGLGGNKTGGGFSTPTSTQSSGLFGQPSQQNAAQNVGQQNAGQQNVGQPGGMFGRSTSLSGGQSGGLFGQNSQQPTSSLFNKPAAPTSAAPPGGGLFGSKPATPGLFGNQNQPQNQSQNQNQSGLGGSLFGSQTSAPAAPSGSIFGGHNAAGGLFGSNANANNASNQGSLFGSGLNTTSKLGNPSGALNGGGQAAPGTTSGGLFGSSSTASGGTSGGLFGGSSFGTRPAGSTFGAPQQPLQAQPQPQPQPLIATIDQASYILQGVSPSQKLYTSLTQPAQKRAAHETHEYADFSAEDRFNSPVRDFSKSAARRGDRKEAVPKLVGAPVAISSTPRSSVALAGVSRSEPRQWVNSYDKFLKERPTSLIIQRDRHRPLSLPHPPVSAAPPPAASIADSQQVPHPAGESTLAGDRTVNVSTVEPDVSLFHRRANNMTVVQVNKRALEEGYYIFPRLETLSAMSKSQLGAVSNLVVGRENYGQIEYPSTVDLSRIPNLGDILGTLVVFEAGTVCVYPDEETIASPGHELNLPCTVTIENAWPIDSATRKKITDMEDPRMQKHINRLREKCEADGGEFVTFVQGVWVFKVPHFSKWGLPADEMVVDSADDRLTEEGPGDESPLVVVVDSFGVPTATAAGEFDASHPSLEDSAMEVGDLESEDIDTWQDQLSHAAFGIYTAAQESLVAASAPPESYNLEAVLMPETSPGGEQPDSASTDKANEAARSEDLQDVKAALHGPLRLDVLRRYVKKHSRNHSTLPMLETALGVEDLQRLYPQRSELWSLLAAVHSPNGVDTEKLSQWLETASRTTLAAESSSSSLPSSSSNDELAAIWTLIMKHLLSDAVRLALKSNNPHLGVLIALLDQHGESREDAEQQLRAWKESRTSASIPIIIRNVWELAAGAAPAPSGLTWAQWLGMRLWYSNASVNEAVSKMPSALVNESGSEFALIREAVGSKPLKAVVESLSLVESFFLLQALNTISSITGKQDLKCYDSVCVLLAKTLQKLGEASAAVYIALHCKDTKTCFDVVHEILVEASDSVSLNMTQDFGVPDELLDEARAAHSKNKKDFRLGAEYLFKAGLFDQAHQLMIENVAPRAVLDGALPSIEDLLVSLESKKDKLRNWSLGGNVYLEYVRALKAGSSVGRYEVKALCNSCRYANTPNLLSRAAISIIARWVASTPFATREFGLDDVLNMKLGPSYGRLTALEQASRLLK